MKQALPLRPYQKEALAARAATDAQRALLSLPTGGGKTVVFAHQSLKILEYFPDGQVLVLVHTDELVQQAVKKLRTVAPHLQVGIVKGTKHNDVLADVVVGSVQTLKNEKRLAQLRHVRHVIVDEAHHATATSYLTILNSLGCFTPGGPGATGYTATPARGDGQGLGTVWQELVYQKDIVWMVRQRYLVNPVGRAIEVPDLDLRAVAATRTDFRKGELGEALAESLAPQKVAQAIKEHASDRKVLAFFPTVASCYVFAAAMEEEGLEARVIHGGMSDDDRAANLAWHRRGTVLVNCMILTEGYDDPEVDCVVIGRPTKSRPLYIQMAGRGLRVDPARRYEDQDCLLLHVTQVGANLRGMVDLSSRDPKEPKDGMSLLDMEEELDAGPAWDTEDAQEYWTGEVVSREFDPLGRPSAEVWIRTKDGTYFLPAGTSMFVFIMEWPGRGLWSVAVCGRNISDRFVMDNKTGMPMPRPNGRPVVMTEHRGLPLDQALVWATDLAMDLGTDLNKTDKAAPWRKKKPTEKFIRFARAIGVTPEGHRDEVTGQFVCTERQGSLSDRCDEVIGTRRIDPIVRAVRSR